MNFALLKQRVDGFAAEMKHLMAVRGLGCVSVPDQVRPELVQRPPLSLPAFGANLTFSYVVEPQPGG